MNLWGGGVLAPVFTIGTAVVGFAMLLLWGAIPLVMLLISPDRLAVRDAWDALLSIAIGGLSMAAGWGLIRRRAWGWWLSIAWLLAAWLLGIVVGIYLGTTYGYASGAALFPISGTIFFGGALAIILVPTLRKRGQRISRTAPKPESRRSQP